MFPFPIRPHLLWEYDLDAFDFQRSADLVIERIIQRGNRAEWRSMILYYGAEKVLSVARASRQLDRKDKNFAELYVFSTANAA